MKKKVTAPVTASWEEVIIERLKKDTELCADLLTDAMNEKDQPIFLSVLHDIVKAHGIKKISAKTKIPQKTLNAIFSQDEPLEVGLLARIVSGLGWRLAFQTGDSNPSSQKSKKRQNLRGSALLPKKPSRDKNTFGKIDRKDQRSELRLLKNERI